MKEELKKKKAKKRKKGKKEKSSHSLSETEKEKKEKSRNEKKRNKKFYEKNQIVRFSERNKTKRNKKPSISQLTTQKTHSNVAKRGDISSAHKVVDDEAGVEDALCGEAVDDEGSVLKGAELLGCGEDADKEHRRVEHRDAGGARERREEHRLRVVVPLAARGLGRVERAAHARDGVGAREVAERGVERRPGRGAARVAGAEHDGAVRGARDVHAAQEAREVVRHGQRAVAHAQQPAPARPRRRTHVLQVLVCPVLSNFRAPSVWG